MKKFNFFQPDLCIEKGMRLNMKKHIPQRTCIGCNQKKDKKDLIRIVKNASDNSINIDKTGKLAGRGAYICDNVECLEKAIKTKKIQRVFEIKIEDEIYNNLRGVIIDK